MLLYKYKGLKSDNGKFYAIESLKDKYLYFSRPSELNDPFDCNIQVSVDASDKEYLQWIKEKRKKMIPGNKLSTVAGIKQAIKDPAFIEGLTNAAKEIIETNHVLSLTTDCMNESMWALYASNYNGICIGYNISDSNISLNPKKVEFSEINTYDCFSTNLKPIPFEEILYDNKGENPLPIFRTDTIQVNNVLYNLTHKKECWANEHEYRAIIHDTDYYDMPIGRFTTKVFYEDSILTEILFGYKTSPEQINSIVELVQKNYTNQIKFYTIFPNLTKYILEKKLLEI